MIKKLKKQIWVPVAIVIILIIVAGGLFIVSKNRHNAKQEPINKVPPLVLSNPKEPKSQWPKQEAKYYKAAKAAEKKGDKQLAINNAKKFLALAVKDVKNRKVNNSKIAEMVRLTGSNSVVIKQAK